MAAPDKADRTVFVGNIPYDLSEELILGTLGRVGQVLSFRLVHDRETGNPKGFGFAEYPDHDSAASAIRNLNEYELAGRKLRVDWSNEGTSSSSANKHNQNVNGQEPAQSAAASSALPPLPPGVDVPPNLTTPDVISRTLKTLPPPQLLDILSQMKGLVMSDPAKATELLQQAPQLSYAIFQSLLLLGLVDTSTLATVVEQAAAAQPIAPPPSLPPQQHQQSLPPQQQPPPQQFGGFPQMGGTPVPAPHPYQMPQPTPQPPPPQPQQQQSMLAPGGVQSREDLLRVVMGLSPQQIEALPPAEKAQIMALRQQLLGAGAGF